MTGSSSLSRALASDYRAADLDVVDSAMLDYAVKLTCAPATVGDADIERLRGVGFTDAGILDICQLTAYYNYVNRLADGLGVELESFWTEEDLTMTVDEFQAASSRRVSAPEGT